MRKKKDIEETSEENTETEESFGETEEPVKAAEEESVESEESETSEEPQREMWKIKCSECGKDAEVPFKPSNDRPVYCRDCFMKRRRPSRDFGRRRF